MNIHIEYCKKWNYEPEFDRVSKIILTINNEVNIQGNKIEPRTGSFEVTINGKIFFSRFECDSFPTKEEIYSWFN